MKYSKLWSTYFIRWRKIYIERIRSKQNLLYKNNININNIKK